MDRGRAGGSGPGEEGFAVAVVVFLLFAIGVAGATAYGVVYAEASMSLNGQQGSRAFAAAAAGMERFLAEEGDSVPVERSYALQGAQAVISSRLVGRNAYPHHLYVLRSLGTFTDPRFTESTARRTMHQMALHRRAPLRLKAALSSPSGSVYLDDMVVNGNDQDTSGTCPGAGSVDIGGILTGGSLGTDDTSIYGSPQTASYGSASAVLDSLDVRWDVLTDPAFPAEHDDTWPTFFTMSPDSFPVVRWTSDLTVSSSYQGWGVLIVDGALSFDEGFTWKGVVLADSLGTVNDSDSSTDNFQIQGAMAVGLNGSGSSISLRDGWVRYHSCYVLDAGRSLAYLDPLDGTWWEAF